jgi:hypothetical protein
LQFRFQEDEKLAQQQKEVTTELELVLVTDQSAECVEDFNHNNVFNYEESNISKKMEEIEPIPLQPVYENSETKEQIKNPLVVEELEDQPISEEETIEAKGHNEKFLDLFQEIYSMKIRKLHFIFENVEIKEGIDMSTMKQEFLKKNSHTNGLYCDADEVFDENLERKLYDGVFFLWCIRWCLDPGKKHSLAVEKEEEDRSTVVQ